MKILFATDGSEYSDGAAKFLAKFNFSKPDEISVLHAVSWSPVISEWETIDVDFRQIQDEVVPRILEASENILRESGAEVGSSFVEAFPDKAIVEKAAEWGADIIVMGASGVRGIGAQLVGSVTRLVAIKSHTPVFVVRPPQIEASDKLKVLFATDGSVFSGSVGKVLGAIPFPAGTELTVLNIIPSMFSDIPERFAVEINDRIKDIVAREKEKEFKKAEEIVKAAGKDLGAKFNKIDELVKIGDPSEEIIKTAASLDIDVIALGSSGMGGIKGLLGSISRYVLNHCKCSVLIGKN